MGGRGHAIIAVPNCDLSWLLKNHAVCPRGSISLILITANPNLYPFLSLHPLTSLALNRWSCLLLHRKKNEAFGGASIGFPSLILITPSSAPSLQPKEGEGLLGSESCVFLPSQRSLCAKYHTSSPSWDFSLGTFPQAHKHAQVSHVLKKLQSFLIHVFFNYWSFHSPINSLNKLYLNTYCVPGTILGAGIQQRTKENPDSHGNYILWGEIENKCVNE